MTTGRINQITTIKLETDRRLEDRAFSFSLADRDIGFSTFSALGSFERSSYFPVLQLSEAYSASNWLGALESRFVLPFAVFGIIHLIRMQLRIFTHSLIFL